MKIRLTFFFFILLINCFSQNMKEGFSLLENGNYKAATLFFSTILKEYPNNKTAKICLGRAIGLNGNPIRSKTIFNELLTDFPNDYEVKLNYAESLLWNNDFKNAKSFYQKLIIEKPNNFNANLGYANTLSNLKLYPEALQVVDKALAIDNGNPNALNSKKYIRLGYAYSEMKKNNFDFAEQLLKNNLKDFPSDIDSQKNLADLYINTNEFDKAENTFNQIRKNKTNEIVALNGLSLVKHLQSKNKIALDYSLSAIELITSANNTDVKNKTIERFIQALIWNKKYALAEEKIKNTITDIGEQNWILALRATLNTYKSNFTNSINDYEQILKNDSKSFDGNLGLANAFFASGLYNNTFNQLDKTKEIFKNQKDVIGFSKKLNQKFTPLAITKFEYSKDNGNNEAYETSINIQFPLSTKFKLLGNANNRNTQNSVLSTKANTSNITAGFEYVFMPKIKISSQLGYNFSDGFNNTFNQFISDLKFTIKPTFLQNLEIGYQRKLQDFNSDLINRQIIENHIYGNYNLNTNFKLGVFAQYFYTLQNDDNIRNLGFVSIYYNLTEKPFIKTGLNYQFMKFKNQLPSVYFSPEQFNAYEIFINLIKSEAITTPKSFFYELTGATGFQKITDNKTQNTYRINANLGYKFSDRTSLKIYGSQTNIASTTASGFTFSQFGLLFKWYVTKQPVFNPNKEKN